MIRKYVYNEKDYTTEYQVRQAIWEKDHIAFSTEPSNKTDRIAFWKKFGVTYIEEPTPLPQVKARKLQEIEYAFNRYRNDTAVVESSLGNTYDADRRAYMDVTGAAMDLEAEETIKFRDAFNEWHDLTKTNLDTLAKEIRANQQRAYVVKWELQQKVEQAQTEEDVNSIEVSFDIKPLVSTMSMWKKSALDLPRI